MSGHTPGPLDLQLIESDTGRIRHFCPMDADGLSLLTVVDHNGKKFAAVYKDEDARLIAAAPDLLQELKNLRRAYVNLLESGRDRILFLGGQCDVVDVMESADPNLRSADTAIAKATTK